MTLCLAGSYKSGALILNNVPLLKFPRKLDGHLAETIQGLANNISKATNLPVENVTIEKGVWEMYEGNWERLIAEGKLNQPKNPLYILGKLDIRFGHKQDGGSAHENVLCKIPGDRTEQETIDNCVDVMQYKAAMKSNSDESIPYKYYRESSFEVITQDQYDILRQKYQTHIYDYNYEAHPMHP
jgi:hypothetical protein